MLVIVGPVHSTAVFFTPLYSHLNIGSLLFLWTPLFFNSIDYGPVTAEEYETYYLGEHS